MGGHGELPAMNHSQVPRKPLRLPRRRARTVARHRNAPRETGARTASPV